MVGGAFEQLQSHPGNIRRGPQTFLFVMKFDEHQTHHFSGRNLVPKSFTSRSHLSEVDEVPVPTKPRNMAESKSDQ